MKTQLEYAKKGILTEQMKQVAEGESMSTETVLSRVGSGEIVIPNNPARPHQKVVGIGRGLRTKINASIGTSSDICDIEAEIEKVKTAENEGADTLMDLSAAGDLDAIHREVLENTALPVGNVPLY